MVSFTRRRNNVDTIDAAHINELQVGVETLTPGPGEIITNEGTGPVAKPLSSIGGGRNLTAITVAAADSPAWMKARADYVCDGVDDHVQWQAAIDEAQTYVVTNTHGAPNVEILPGRYILGGTVTWKSCHLLATYPNSSVRVGWSGPAGGTAIVKSATHGGGLSFGRMYGFQFAESYGTTVPQTWLDLSAGSVDKYLTLDTVAFSGGHQQVRIGTWVNAHWRDLRFDRFREYALVATPAAFANLDTFLIDGFTADYILGDGTTTGRGVFRIDNTANASALGTFHLKDGRVEINSQYAAGSPKGLVVLTLPNPGNSRVVGVHIDNVTYDDVVSNSGDSLLAIDTTATNLVGSLLLTNVRQTGITAVIGGTIPSFQGVVPVQANYGHVAVAIASGGESVITDQIGLHAGADRAGMRLFQGTEAQPRCEVWSTGELRWGSGSAAYDTTLTRTAANTLGTGVDDAFRVGRAATASRPAATTVGSGAMFYDTTLNKPIWSDGTAWRDASGTVV